jgi:hypothetical protein
MKYKLAILILISSLSLSQDPTQDPLPIPSSPKPTYNPSCGCQHLLECPKCSDPSPKPPIFCPCAPALQCPPCPYLGIKSIKSIHEAAANEALLDAQSQENLMK